MNFSFKASDIEKHSSAHILAAAVRRVFPGMKVGIGPVTKAGFYYDFDLPETLTEEHLEEIQNNIDDIISEDLPFKQILLQRNEAYNLLLQLGQIYKAELVQSLSDEQVSLYKLGDEFIDLCRGPHINSTSEAGIIKISSTDTAHWKDDASRPVLQRIYGHTFINESELESFRVSLSTMQTRNFIQVSRKGGLATVSSNDNSLILTPNGVSVVDAIRVFCNSFMKEVHPQRIHAQTFDLFENTVNEILKYKVISHRDIPLSYYSSIWNHEYEINRHKYTGPLELHRMFTQTNQLIFMVSSLLDNVLDAIEYLTKSNFKVGIYTTDLEDSTVKTVSTLLTKKLISHDKVLSKNVDGDTDIEIMTIDSIGKEWVLARLIVQNNSKYTYQAQDNEKLPLSSVSIEFHILPLYAFIIEEFGIAMPTILHPVQALIIPLSKEVDEYIGDFEKKLRRLGLRTRIDKRSRSFNAKLREAHNRHIPYIVIIGNKEVQTNSVSLRKNGKEVGLLDLDSLEEMIIQDLKK